MRVFRAALLLALLAPPARADLVFVSDERGDDLRVVSTERGAVVAAIPVGKRPRGMCLAPDGKTVFVALGDEDAVALVDVASRALVRKVAVGRDPEQPADRRADQESLPSARDRHVKNTSDPGLDG